MSNHIADTIEQKSNELVELMLEHTQPHPHTTRADQRQFVVGFVHVLGQSARGNTEPRDQYLTAVIPALKAARLPQSIVMEGMVGVAMALAAFLAHDREAVAWAVTFCVAYTRDLTIAYEA